MTIFVATTTVDMFRGETEDANGPIASTEPFTDPAKPIPVAVTEKSRTVYLPETSEVRTIRYSVGRLVATVDVRKGDRWRDTRTGKFWAVDEVVGGERSAIGQTPLVCDLRRV